MVALLPAQGDDPLITGQAERIGPDGELALKDAQEQPLQAAADDWTSDESALVAIIATIKTAHPALVLAAVGHSVVHGCPDFTDPVLVTDEVLDQLARLSSFALLHQSHNIAGIREAMAAFPGVPQVACLNTAFHRGQPFVNDTFATPFRYYEKGVRRYGCHGLSHDDVTGELARIAPHLGNGASNGADMDAKALIARRVAREIQPGTLVNLRIGLPSLVANFVPATLGVFFQAENGVIALGARWPEGMEYPHLTDADGGFVTAVPGAASIDSAMSFGLIRGGYLDVTVLGSLQVDKAGHLASWKVPGKMVPGMAGQ